MNQPEPPEPGSQQRMVLLLAIAVIEADEPQCLTPARCMMRHGPHCRVTRWNAIVDAINTEMSKQPNSVLGRTADETNPPKPL